MGETFSSNPTTDSKAPSESVCTPEPIQTLKSPERRHERRLAFTCLAFALFVLHISAEDGQAGILGIYDFQKGGLCQAPAMLLGRGRGTKKPKGDKPVVSSMSFDTV